MTNLLKQFENSEAIVAPYQHHPRGTTNARLYGSSHGLLRVKGPAVTSLKGFPCYQVNLFEEDSNKKLLIKFTKEGSEASGRRHKNPSRSTVSLGIAQFLNKAKINPADRSMVFSFDEDNGGLVFDDKNKILLLDFSRCITEKADWRKPTDKK